MDYKLILLEWIEEEYGLETEEALSLLLSNPIYGLFMFEVAKVINEILYKEK